MATVPSRRLEQHAQAYVDNVRRLRRHPPANGIDIDGNTADTRRSFREVLHEECGLDRDAVAGVMHWLCARPDLPVGEIIDRAAAGEVPPRSPESAPARELAAVQTIADALLKAEASGNPAIAGPSAAGTLEALLITAISDACGVDAGTARRAAAAVTGPAIPGEYRDRSVSNAVGRALAEEEDQEPADRPRPAGNAPAMTEAEIHGGHYMVTRYALAPYGICPPGYLGGQKPSCACGDDTCAYAAEGTARTSAARALYRQGWSLRDITAALGRPPAERAARPGPARKRTAGPAARPADRTAHPRSR